MKIKHKKIGDKNRIMEKYSKRKIFFKDKKEENILDYIIERITILEKEVARLKGGSK